MTTNEAQVAMDGSPATVDLYNRKNVVPGHMEVGPFGTIKWQVGPIHEVGINGTTIEDVLDVLAARLRGFQSGPFKCRENALAITAIEEARNWLLQRTRARQAQGVEGFNKPHEDASA